VRCRRTLAAAGSRTARAVVCVVVCLVTAATARAADRPPIVASRGDAFVTHEDGTDRWSIGSANLELVIGFDNSRTLALLSLTNPVTGRAWGIVPGPEFSINAGGERITLTASGAVALLSASATTTEHGVTISFTFEHRAQRLRFTRVYACYPGSPTIETWTTVSSTGGDGSALNDLVAWNMTMPNGNVRWLGGLRGDYAGSDSGVEDAFVFAEHDFEPGERLDLGSEGRSSEQFVPFFLVDDGRDEFFGGLMWSGSWRASLERVNDQLRVGVSFPGVATSVTPSKPFEMPHTFFGVAAKSTTDETGALRQFVLQGIRHGRPFQPLVTYNTWFVYGTRLTEDDMVAEMDRAATLGVELFVMDAGWYLGAGETGDFDFDSGLGSWKADPDRFPSGLASLADYAHGVGMKFGLWVEPERVSQATVGKAGLAQEPWLATRGNDYGSALNAQICLSGAAGRKWVMDQLVALVEQVRPDYLKWDNNFWLNCDRAGHGHGPADGNMAHVQALYGVLDELRRRYPDLLIENVSGGGSRLDFGMMAYTDTAWMDDRTSPASHVRHNIEGLTFAFPPAYLLSFLIDADGEPIAGAADLSLLTRSRAAGILGLTYRASQLDEDTAELLRQQIAQYKTYRDIITQSNATLLTAQAPVDSNGWDVLQEVTDDGRTMLIFGFKGGAESGRIVVRPRGLLPDATYDVQSIDVGPIGAALGDVLMQDGIELIHAGGSLAHVLILKAR
jgi:alpha-galactosidase